MKLKNMGVEKEGGRERKTDRQTKIGITRPAWAGFKTAEEGRANTPFGVGGPRG